MQIQNVYGPGPVICRPSESITKAAHCMRAQQVIAVAVCDDGRVDQLVGVFKERDIVQD